MKREFVSLKVGSLACAVDIAGVQEINRQTNVTRVDQAPPYVAGIINLRGQVVTVVNLRERLGLGPPEAGAAVYNLLVKSEGELIGLLVDDVDDIVAIDVENIKAAPPHLDRGLRQYIDEVVEMKQEVVAVLAVDRVTAAEDTTN